MSIFFNLLSVLSSLFGNRRGFHAINPSFSPDGTKITFAGDRDGPGDIYVMNADGSTVTRLTKTKGFKGFPAFSPDGKHIAFAAEPADDKERLQIYVMNADGTGVTRLTHNKLSDFKPSYSPDGKRIVFLRAHLYRDYSMGGHVWDRLDIYVMNADGTNERRVTHGNYYMTMDAPHFSHDGKQIVSGADLNIHGESYHKNHEIFVVGADGKSPPHRLTSGPRLKTPAPPFPWRSGEPVFSPNEKKIAFISDRSTAYSYDVWIMNVDGTSPQRLTIHTSNNYNYNYNMSPSFAPDGKSIIFLSDPAREGRFELWRVDVDGKNPRLVAPKTTFHRL